MIRLARFLSVLLSVTSSLACVCSLASLQPLEPTAVPTAKSRPQEKPTVWEATTDVAGQAVVTNGAGVDRAIVQVQDADSAMSVAGMEIWYLEKGPRYLVVAMDPEARYLGAWSEGTYEELQGSDGTLHSLGSVLQPPPAEAQTLPIILLLVKLASTVSSLHDLDAYLQDPPDLKYWSVLYEERCWTGDQLANLVGASGLFLSGVERLPGVAVGEMDDISKALRLLAEHLLEEEAKELLIALDRPVRIRSYHLGIPPLFMIPQGWCDTEPIPTDAQALEEATSPPSPPKVEPPSKTPESSLSQPQVAFVSDRDTAPFFEIYVMDSDGGNLSRLTHNDTDDTYPAWSPDATRVAFVYENRIHVMNADGTGRTRLTSRWAMEPKWSPDGTRIAFTPGDEIHVLWLDGRGETNVTNHPANDGDPCWSPDGSRIAFSSNRDGNSEIYVMRSDGAGASRLTNSPADDYRPSWSPDGERIAFESYRDGNGEVYVMNADGTGLTNVTNNPSWDGEPSWCGDANLIAFTTSRDGSHEIYLLHRDDGAVTRLTTNPAMDWEPACSP